MLTAILAVVAAAGMTGVIILERIRRKNRRDIARSAAGIPIGYARAEELVAGEGADAALRLLVPDHADRCDYGRAGSSVLAFSRMAPSTSWARAAGRLLM